MSKQGERLISALIIIGTLILSVFGFTIWLSGLPSFGSDSAGPEGGLSVIFSGILAIWSLPLSWLGGALISYAVVKPVNIWHRHLLFAVSTLVLAIVMPYPVSWAIGGGFLLD